MTLLRFQPLYRERSCPYRAKAVLNSEWSASRALVAFTALVVTFFVALTLNFPIVSSMIFASLAAVALTDAARCYQMVSTVLIHDKIERVEGCPACRLAWTTNTPAHEMTTQR